MLPCYFNKLVKYTVDNILAHSRMLITQSPLMEDVGIKTFTNSFGLSHANVKIAMLAGLCGYAFLKLFKLNPRNVIIFCVVDYVCGFVRFR